MENKEEIISQLKKLARKAKGARQRRQYDIVRLYLEGRKKTEIAEIMDMSLQAIYNVLNRYNAEGIEGLKLGKPTGRSRKLSDEQEAELYQVITEKLPKEVGLEPFCNWTAPLACQYVKKQFGVEFSARGMRDVFYRLRLSYTRPTYTLAKADPVKQEAFKERLESLKKLLEEEIACILYEDESMIRDYQAIQKTWFAKGQQRIIPTYGKHEGVKLVGFLNYETGEVYVEEHKKYDAEVFRRFLTHVLKHYPEGEIAMILDNAKIHHANLLKDLLEANPRLHLVFLPPYSPNLNKIEELWGWLKSSVINNVFFPDREHIHKAVLNFIDYVNSVPAVVIDRLCL